MYISCTVYFGCDEGSLTNSNNWRLIWLLVSKSKTKDSYLYQRQSINSYIFTRQILILQLRVSTKPIANQYLLPFAAVSPYCLLRKVEHLEIYK